MSTSTATAVLAVLTVLVIILFAAAWHSGACTGGRGKGRAARDRFYTEHSREEPTRADTPYTGSIPFGPWGVRPWGVAAPPPPGCPAGA